LPQIFRSIFIIGCRNETYGLQAVDLFCWGIFQKYEKNNFDWLDVYKEKVCLMSNSYNKKYPNRRLRRSGRLRHAAVGRHLAARRPARQAPRLAAGRRSLPNGAGPRLRLAADSGTIGAHAITREVHLWRNSQRIEFAWLNTTQRDNGIFCIRFPIGISGKNKRRESLRSRIARSSRARAVSRRELLHRFSRRLRRHPLDRRFVAAVRLHPSSVRPACTAVMRSRRASRRSSLSWTAFSRCRRTLSAARRRPWTAAGSIIGGAPCCPCGNLADACSYRHALEQHVPLLAWSPARGLERGGASPLPEIDKPDRPAQDASLAEGLFARRRVAGRSVTGQRRSIGDAAGASRQARRCAAGGTASLRIDRRSGGRYDPPASPRRIGGRDEFPRRGDCQRRKTEGGRQ